MYEYIGFLCFMFAFIGILSMAGHCIDIYRRHR